MILGTAVVAILALLFQCGATSVRVPGNGAGALRTKLILEKAIVAVQHQVGPLAKWRLRAYAIAMKRNYILIRYRYGEGGGDAIVLYEAHQDRSFRVLGRGGGAMDAGIISAFGVPKPIATTLVQYAAGKCPSQYRVELKNRAVANDAKGCADASTRR